MIDKTLAAISDCILVEAVQTISYFSARNVFFPGLEIIQNKRQVFQDGEEVNLTPPPLNTIPLCSLLPIPALSHLYISY